MRIEIVQGQDQAYQAAGVNVVIDVIRAFTVAQLAFMRGAREIVLAADIGTALLLHEQMPDAWLAGEVNGLPVPGFDLDNSPVRMNQADVAGRTLIQMTTNGVRAALGAQQAQHVLVTGFAGARAVARYVHGVASDLGNPLIRLIATHPTSDDDIACAEYIRGMLLQTGIPDAQETAQRIRRSEVAVKFLDPSQSAFDPADIEWCAREIDVAFVMCVTTREGVTRVERVGL